MQRAMADVRASDPARADLALTVGVSAGAVWRTRVGDPDVQLLEVVAGDPVREMARAERAARPGQVAVTDALLARTGTLVRATPLEDGLAVAHALTASAPTRPWPEVPPTPADIARAWVLPSAVRPAHGRRALPRGASPDRVGVRGVRRGHVPRGCRVARHLHPTRPARARAVRRRGPQPRHWRQGQLPLRRVRRAHRPRGRRRSSGPCRPGPAGRAAHPRHLRRAHRPVRRPDLRRTVRRGRPPDLDGDGRRREHGGAADGRSVPR